VVLHMLANVQQVTIKPVITAAVAPGTLVHTATVFTHLVIHNKIREL